MNENLPWTEKFRPKKIDDLIQSPHLLEQLKNNIIKKEMPHYLFYGPPGTGKTSSAIVLARELFGNHFVDRTIEFNASDDRGIKAIRDKITVIAKNYVNEIKNDDGTLIPSFKIIILDEADSMTEEAQDALRIIIEKYSTVTRFIFICNYKYIC